MDPRKLMGYGIILISMVNKLRIGTYSDRYYDREADDFGTNRYFELNGKWYYGNDSAVQKGLNHRWR